MAICGICKFILFEIQQLSTQVVKTVNTVVCTFCPLFVAVNNDDCCLELKSPEQLAFMTEHRNSVFCCMAHFTVLVKQPNFNNYFPDVSMYWNIFWNKTIILW